MSNFSTGERLCSCSFTHSSAESPLKYFLRPLNIVSSVESINNLPNRRGRERKYRSPFNIRVNSAPSEPRMFSHLFNHSVCDTDLSLLGNIALVIPCRSWSLLERSGYINRNSCVPRNTHFRFSTSKVSHYVDYCRVMLIIRCPIFTSVAS